VRQQFQTLTGIALIDNIALGTVVVPMRFVQMKLLFAKHPRRKF